MKMYSPYSFMQLWGCVCAGRTKNEIIKKKLIDLIALYRGCNDSEAINGQPGARDTWMAIAIRIETNFECV